ncbi:MAG: DUF559 domain-containing protein [Saprospiraceae bacterium]|nr:DUF559 domain-containing protein [Saprospiraceae bacterium]
MSSGEAGDRSGWAVSHKQKAADSLRDEILLGMKVKTLRFDNESILNNMEGVCKIIDEVIESKVSNGGEKETGA